ncbi:MAG TPA: glycosyl hydrolase family 57 [Verrucomicrobiae bacterium]|nr:glycosyl hydrolase family 57 [Verrucomicrobiae bacterium]
MSIESIPEIIDGLPNISGWEKQVEQARRRGGAVFLERTPMRLEKIQSAFAIALHMHQPLILGNHDLQSAPMIGNLQFMMENQHIHGNHDAPVFAHCYTRIADFIRELVDAGRQPRMMLDYSGELLFGLRQMGRGDILDNLKSVTLNDRYWPCVEWIGTMWGHAVVPSTPVPDVSLHVVAWQHYFASVFGWEALARVRGFSPPEMHLPNHPDVAHEYVKTLKDAGYRWLLVQEHSVEESDGKGLRERYLPRRLVARNSRGKEISITALIKTQGSDTKLIGHMQPYYEAKGQQPRECAGYRVPPCVTQISDGENGGVMMNEFPDHYKRVFGETGKEGVVGLNGTEYLELLDAAGVKEKDFEPIQPLHQGKLWERVGDKPTPESVEQAIAELRKSDHRFQMEGASWTNNLSWVHGYENVLDPMNKLSAKFHEKVDGRAVDTRSAVYRNALLHLLVSQTSCYRYWGQGRWTDYAREFCRRGMDILSHDL